METYRNLCWERDGKSELGWGLSVLKLPTSVNGINVIISCIASYFGYVKSDTQPD